MKRGLGGKDHKLNRALRRRSSSAARCRRPTGFSKAACSCHQDRLDLQYGDDTFEKLDDGRYRLKLSDQRKGVGARPHARAQEGADPPRRRRRRARLGRREHVLLLHPALRGDRHGHAPRRRARGRRRARAGTTTSSACGERETSTTRPKPSSTPRRARVCTASAARATSSARSPGTGCRPSSTTAASCRCTRALRQHPARAPALWAVVIDPQGNARSHTDVHVRATEIWRSTQTFFEYPMRWRVRGADARSSTSRSRRRSTIRSSSR